MNMGNLRRIERKDDGGANVAAEVKKVVGAVRVDEGVTTVPASTFMPLVA